MGNALEKLANEQAILDSSARFKQYATVHLHCIKLNEKKTNSNNNSERATEKERVKNVEEK